MSIRFSIVLCLFFGLAAWADEKLPFLKTDSQVYTNVTVLSVSATDVYFTFNNGGGVANAKLKNLSPELQIHFHYDATKALSVEKKQIAANAHTILSVSPQVSAHEVRLLRPPPVSPKVLGAVR